MKLLLIGLAIVLSSCSSGGDSSSPTDPNTVFQLFSSGYFTPGNSETTTYTGSDDAGGIYTATDSQQTQTQTTFLGQPAIPILSQLQLNNTANGAFVSVISTSYFSTTASDRRYLGYSDSTTSTVSATTTTLPQTAKLGQFGIIGTYTDNAGNVDEQSWRLDDAGNGNAKIILLSTERDQFGSVTTSSTTTTTIDSSGNTLSQQIVVFFSDINVTITLNSN